SVSTLRTCTHRLAFCFPPSRAHRALHSFPTRRSSDLAVFCASGRDFTIAIECIKKLPERWSAGSFFVSRNRFGRHAHSCACLYRSEEHTSELQSRENLVCRLLLEKKKIESTHLSGD